MQKIRHIGRGECSFSSLEKEDFEIILRGKTVEIHCDDYISISLPLKKLEEFIKTHNENLMGVEK